MKCEFALKSCEKCKAESKLYEIKAILSWRAENNYLSGLSYDKEAKVILVNKDSLMRAIQMANPGQAFRDIRLVDNEEFKRVQDRSSDFTSWDERTRKEMQSEKRNSKRKRKRQIKKMIKELEFQVNRTSRAEKGR
nr:hypothetical protein [uncultured Anaerotignum sp.]